MDRMRERCIDGETERGEEEDAKMETLREVMIQI